MALLLALSPWSASAAPAAMAAAHGRQVASVPQIVFAAEEGGGAAASGALEKSVWPANGGFLGEPVDTTLEPGTIVDRYGGPGGSYVSPDGTPFSERGLPSYYENSQPYYRYEVVEPVTVRGGIAAPAFGSSGGGVQYQFGTSIQDLIDSGMLKQVGP
jgi:Tuberculosis necrotizing toxin